MSLEQRKARIAELERAQFERVCVKEILERGKDVLALSVKVALAGQSDQFAVARELVRG